MSFDELAGVPLVIGVSLLERTARRRNRASVSRNAIREKLAPSSRTLATVPNRNEIDDGPQNVFGRFEKSAMNSNFR